MAILYLCQDLIVDLSIGDEYIDIKYEHSANFTTNLSDVDMRQKVSNFIKPELLIEIKNSLVWGFSLILRFSIFKNYKNKLNEAKRLLDNSYYLH